MHSSLSNTIQARVLHFSPLNLFGDHNSCIAPIVHTYSIIILIIYRYGIQLFVECSITTGEVLIVSYDFLNYFY